MSLSVDRRIGPLVRMEGRLKSFRAVEALKGVDRDLRDGGCRVWRGTLETEAEGGVAEG